jgi:hypothetical protein
MLSQRLALVNMIWFYELYYRFLFASVILLSVRTATLHVFLLAEVKSRIILERTGH